MKMKITGVEESLLKDFVVAVRQIKPVSYETVYSAAFASMDTENKKARDEARRILIEQYLRSVIQIAARYRGAGVSFAELIRAGNSGLITAARTMGAEQACNFDRHICEFIEDAVIDTVIRIKNEGKAL
jgi:DNA-directed RNA polymerase sigma subunit (sigma70/sigma32)